MFRQRRMLESLIRSAKPEIEAPQALEARLRAAVAAIPISVVGRPVTSRRRQAVSVVVAVALVGAMASTRGPLQARRGAHLLMAAAAAAQNVTNMHTWGTLRLPDAQGGWQQPLQYEAWVSEEDGWLWNRYESDRTLKISQGMNVADGYLWQYEPEHRRVAIRWVLQPEDMRYPSGKLKSPYGSPGFIADLMESDWVEEQLDGADRVTTWAAQVNGTPVTVIALDESTWRPQGEAYSGSFRREFYVDDFGQFLGEREIARSGRGETVVAEEWHEYDLSMPATTFGFTPPQSVKVYEYEYDESKGDGFGFSPLPWEGE